MGIISSVGNDIPTYWKNLIDGVCGIDYVEDFKDMPVTIAGKVKDFDPDRYDIDKAFVRKQDKFTQFAMAAAWQAMQASGLKTEGDDANIDPFRLGVYVGSGIGGFEIQYRETAKMVEDPTGKWVSPLFIPTMISNIAAGRARAWTSSRPAPLLRTASARRTAPSGTAMPTPSSPAAPSTPPFRSAWPASPTRRPFPAPPIPNTPPSRSTRTGRAS